MRRILPTAVATFATATTALATPAEDMAAMIREWIGHSANELVSVWGEGMRSESRVRTTFYRYYGEGSRPSINAAGITTMQGGRDGCEVSFEVDDKGQVVGASWSTEGASDRERARRACWREFRNNAPRG